MSIPDPRLTTIATATARRAVERRRRHSAYIASGAAATNPALTRSASVPFGSVARPNPPPEHPEMPQMVKLAMNTRNAAGTNPSTNNQRWTVGLNPDPPMRVAM